MHTNQALLGAGTILLAALCLPAQDLLGVSYSGATVRINSHDGNVTPLGPGLAGPNDLVRAANGIFWATQRISSSQNYLTQINPNTGAATVMFSCPDIRGLAVGPGNNLYAAVDGAGSDQLVQIDTTNGFATTIGNFGFTGVQALAMHQGVLYAWDVIQGLLIVDPQTGAAIDPFPGGSVPLYLQSLCSHPDGRLLVGGGDSSGPDELFEVDLGTGSVTSIGQMLGVVDVRGITSLAGFVAPYGQGCNGANGVVTLGVTGSTQVGGTLTATSTNHAANSIGLTVFGVSASSYLGVPLPVLLDPLFSTNGCSLYTSVDGSFALLSGPTAPATLQFSFGIPLGAHGANLNLQHVCLEPVPGGMSWSNGVAVRIE